MIKEAKIISIILFLFIVIILLYGYISNKEGTTLYLPTYEDEICTFFNTTGCDISCQTDDDCKFSVGYCVNINEDVHLPPNYHAGYLEQSCKCEKNNCVGTPTGNAAI